MAAGLSVSKVEVRVSGIRSRWNRL